MPAYESTGYGDLYIEYNVVLPQTISTDMKKSKQLQHSGLINTLTYCSTELGEVFHGHGSVPKDEL